MSASRGSYFLSTSCRMPARTTQEFTRRFYCRANRRRLGRKEESHVDFRLVSIYLASAPETQAVAQWQEVQARRPVGFLWRRGSTVLRVGCGSACTLWLSIGTPTHRARSPIFGNMTWHTGEARPDFAFSVSGQGSMISEFPHWDITPSMLQIQICIGYLVTRSEG